MRQKYISKIVWSKIFNFLKLCANIYKGTSEECKRFVEGIFWMARTGAQWRELPEEYGKWNSVFKRFNAWSKKNVWDELLKFCIQDPDLEYVMIDATVVRAHASAAGYGEQEEEGFGRSAGGFTSKIHVLVDALGNPLKVVVTPGQCSDITQADDLLEDISGAYVLAD